MTGGWLAALSRCSGVVALVVASAVAGALPVAIGYWAADRLGGLWYRCAPRQRASVRANLTTVLAGRAMPAERSSY